MRHYKIWNPDEKPRKAWFTIQSNGLLLRLISPDMVYLTFDEIKEALTLEGTACYSRFEELYLQKPRPALEQPLTSSEQSELERLFW